MAQIVNTLLGNEALLYLKGKPGFFKLLHNRPEVAKVFFCILSEDNDVVKLDDFVLPPLLGNDKVNGSLKRARCIA